MTARGRRTLKRCVSGAACALWLAFIFANSLRSRAASAKQSAFAEELLRHALRSLSFSGDVGHTAEFAVRKGAHIFEFSVLFILAVLFSGCLFKRRKAAVTAAAALSLAAATADELLQLISKRGASASDVLIDAAGIALGGLAYLLFVRLQKRRERKNRSDENGGAC